MRICKFHNFISKLVLFIFLLQLSACEDFLSSIKNENTQDISSLLYSVEDLDVVINGAYGVFCSSTYYGLIQIDELLGSDCIMPTTNPIIQPDFNSLTRDNYFLQYLSNVDDYQAGGILQWGSFVNNNSNLVLQSIQNKLPILKNANDSINATRLMGEAMLMRASVEFYNNFFVGRQYHATTIDSLSTLYRRKPVLSFDDMAEPRKKVSEVYQFLENDLLSAKQLLPEKYNKLIHPAAYQFRCKKDVATAMLAKVYFQQNKFTEALAQIKELLGNENGISSKFPLVSGDAYSKIFQTPNSTNYQAGNGSEIIMAFHGNSAFLPTLTSRWPIFQWTAFKNLQNGDITQCKFRVVLDRTFVEQWLDGDTAKDIRYKQLIYITKNSGKESPAGQWTSLKAAYPTSNVLWLRASEFHLMRAEIYLHLNKIAYSVIELNLIRERAGLSAISNNVPKEDLMKLIIEERLREMYFENVRRWDNLRLASLSGSSYGSYLPEPYKSGFIPLGNRNNLIPEKVLAWNANRLYCLIPQNEYIFNPALNK